MKAEPGITHHDSQYDALFLVLGKIIGAQHFSSNADKTGLFAFILFFLFFSSLQFSIIKFSHNIHALFFFLFKSQTPLFQNWNKSSLRQTRPLICPRYQKIYPFFRLVMLIFLLRTGTPSNSYIVFG